MLDLRLEFRRSESREPKTSQAALSPLLASFLPKFFILRVLMQTKAHETELEAKGERNTFRLL
jgi:hypothetical protein